MTANRRKFILIEQSLREVGGHYFEYAGEILRAAEAAGFEPVLACHQQFAEADRFPSGWKIYPLFPFTSDRIHRIPSAYSFGLWQQVTASRGNLPAIASRVADALTDRCKAAVSGLRWWRRLSRIRGFAAACESLFHECPVEEGDQVLCSTMSDMDLLGLARFLRGNLQSVRADWHLQFHFSVYCGRDPDYAAQDSNTQALRERMKRALASIPQHRLHFYTTTDELGRQFDRLNVAKFETLPWPVGQQFHGSPHASCDAVPHAEREAHQVDPPLRVICAGAVRREKGSDQLGSLAKSLWSDLLEPRAAQLLFQLGPKRRWQKMLELPPGSFAAAADIDNLPDAPLVSLPHPLQPHDYAKLIKSADIGLLLYNSDVYFARCSGILAELLAAGVPVIVPAGGWLAEQIAEENFRYLDQLAQARHLAPRDECISRSEMPGNLTDPIQTPQGSADLLVRVWRLADHPGSYLRIEADQLDAQDRPLARFASIVGQRMSAGAEQLPVSALFHLSPQCASVRLKFAGAYRQTLPAIENWSAEFLASPNEIGAHWPAGKVGLTMTGPADVPTLLRDIVHHHQHYREAARGFATHWIVKHAAERTIRQLTNRTSAGSLPRATAA